MIYSKDKSVKKEREEKDKRGVKRDRLKCDCLNMFVDILNMFIEILNMFVEI